MQNGFCSYYKSLYGYKILFKLQLYPVNVIYVNLFQYLKTLKLAHCDILNIFSGIQYLPLDKQTFLNVQCFINLLECNYPIIKHTAFLYNEHLIW